MDHQKKKINSCETSYFMKGHKYKALMFIIIKCLKQKIRPNPHLKSLENYLFSMEKYLILIFFFPSEYYYFTTRRRLLLWASLGQKPDKYENPGSLQGSMPLQPQVMAVMMLQLHSSIHLSSGGQGLGDHAITQFCSATSKPRLARLQSPKLKQN